MLALTAMPSDVNAVLFDLDGTLVNTIPLILACYEHTLGVHAPGLVVPRSVLVGNLGRSLDDILRDYAVTAGLPDADAASREMGTTYRSFQRENIDRLIQPYEGVNAALRALRELGLTLGLVTSKVEWAARLTYERYGLGEFLSILVFHDDTERHKPDPEPLLLAAAKGGLTPGRTAYVGDSVHDMAAGRAADMISVGALWGPSEPDALRRAGADALAETPLALVSLFQGSGLVSQTGPQH
jgi:pyrophosphatase PpaX